MAISDWRETRVSRLEPTRDTSTARGRFHTKPVPEVKLKHITPSFANECLNNLAEELKVEGTPIRQRKLNDRHVRNVARQQRLRRFDGLNGDTLAFAVRTDGTWICLNGQHRLAATVLSGCSWDGMVMLYVDPASFSTMDQGMVRTAHHVADYKEPGSVNAAVNAIIRWREDGVKGFQNRQTRHFNPDFEEFTKSAEGQHFIKHITSMAAKVKRSGVLSLSTYATAWAIFREVDEGLAEEFLNGVITGEGLMADDPAYVVREKLLRNKATGGHGTRKKYSNNERYYVLFRGFEHYCKGERVKAIHFSKRKNLKIPDISKLRPTIGL